MKNATLCLLVVGIMLVIPVQGQQPPQSSVRRHPGDVIRYAVTFEGGDIDKLTDVGVHLSSPGPVPPNQMGFTTQFGGPCHKSPEPKLWTCDVRIPDVVADGDYRFYEVDISAGPFSKSYPGDFHVPIVLVQNPRTFNPPTKVTVTEQP